MTTPVPEKASPPLWARGIVRQLVKLFLGSSALAPTSATRRDLLEGVRGAAGPRGIVDELTHAGDPRDPAQLAALFASPGEPAHRATVLFLHGKGGCGAEWRPDAVRALQLGYNILIPELRGHPPSTGTTITYGLLEKVDLSLLIAEAKKRHAIDAARLGIDACSMGTLVALQFVAEKSASAPESVRALWLQSPFGDLPAMAVHYVHRATSLPERVVRWATLLALGEIERTTGLELSSVDPIAAAARVICPTMVIHGESDNLVPIRFAPAVYEALAGPKEFWRVPRCGHCHHPDEPQALRRAEYTGRWSGFFGTHLPPEMAAATAKRKRKPRPVPPIIVR